MYHHYHHNHHITALSLIVLEYDLDLELEKYFFFVHSFASLLIRSNHDIVGNTRWRLVRGVVGVTSGGLEDPKRFQLLERVPLGSMLQWSSMLLRPQTRTSELPDAMIFISSSGDSVKRKKYLI